MARPTQISLPESLHDELKARAKREGRSFSSLVAFLIESKLRDLEFIEAVKASVALSRDSEGGSQ